MKVHQDIKGQIVFTYTDWQSNSNSLDNFLAQSCTENTTRIHTNHQHTDTGTNTPCSRPSGTISNIQHSDMFPFTETDAPSQLQSSHAWIHAINIQRYYSSTCLSQSSSRNALWLQLMLALFQLSWASKLI